MRFQNAYMFTGRCIYHDTINPHPLSKIFQELTLSFLFKNSLFHSCSRTHSFIHETIMKQKIKLANGHKAAN